jgi:outer membrane protein OmpA-like peptidoglycan-associated protein
MTAPSPAIASAELVGVEFKAGHPAIGESLHDSLKCPSTYGEDSLEDDAQVLKEMPEAVVEITGFTDNQECRDRECHELSLRRARAIYDWFVARGVPPQTLRDPTGRGSDLAIDSNETELGRQRNRRVEVHLIRKPER